MVLIALGALIALGGGAAGAYFYFGKTAEASKIEKFDDESHETASEDGVLSSHEYVELDPLILPIVDQNGVSQTVSMVVVLEVPGGFAKSRVERNTPRLKDAFIQDMYGVLNKHAALKGGVLQVDMLKSRLRKVSKRVVGADNVDDVLLQVVQQRPI